METKIFHLVDVFAEEKYSGNQLAVFRHVNDLSDNQMQRIAKEMHFSETTFILSDEKNDGGYDVRIFTPKNELNFAGHPTLGTAFVIQREILKKPIKEITLNLKAGKIPVYFDYVSNTSCILWMKQLQPIFGKKFDSEVISDILNLELCDINTNFPIQEVSTGLPAIIVPLKTLDAVKKAQVNKHAYSKFIKNNEAKTILIFCSETYNKGNDLNVRFFADHYGIPEDPATGSANGCLAGYLVMHRFFGTYKINLKVEQGYEIDRPSLLYLKAEKKKQDFSVYVGGKVELIGSGKLV